MHADASYECVGERDADQTPRHVENEWELEVHNTTRVVAVLRLLIYLSGGVTDLPVSPLVLDG